MKQVSADAQLRIERRTLETRKQINQVVWDFVKSRNRIVYGGAALDAMLRTCDPLDGLYSGSDVADIEFYSDSPGADVVELCDILHNDHGLRNVQGREAVHQGTLTVSVEFVRCFDITFMSKYMMHHLPTLFDNTMTRCAHPHVMAIDLLRMMTEPDTSYWRLEKAFTRFLLLEKHFPLQWSVDEPDATQPRPEQMTVSEAGEWWHPFVTCAGVGATALCFYEGLLKHVGVDMFPQLVSIDFEEDVHRIRQIAKNELGACTEMHYEAFGDILGKSVQFMNSLGSCVLEVLDAHPRCVPLSPGCDIEGGSFASSLYCLVTSMACHLRAFANNDRQMMATHAILCCRFLFSRKVSRCDGHIAFKDFDFENVLGATMSDMKIQSIAHTVSNPQEGTASKGKAKHTRQKGGQSSRKPWLRYNPSENVNELDMNRKRMTQSSFVSRGGKVVESRGMRTNDVTA